MEAVPSLFFGYFWSNPLSKDYVAGFARQGNFKWPLCIF